LCGGHGLIVFFKFCSIIFFEKNRGRRQLHLPAAIETSRPSKKHSMFERYIEPAYSLIALLFVSNATLLENLTQVDWHQPAFQHAILMIFFLPLSWTLVARTEYHYRWLRAIACGSKKLACYSLAFYIFVVGQYRSVAIHNGMTENQPQRSLLPSTICSWITGCSTETTDFYLGWAIVVIGQVLVLPSMWKLGVAGTYLGD
jgi:hypothetical protein